MERGPHGHCGHARATCGLPSGPSEGKRRASCSHHRSEVLGSGGDGGLHQLPGEPKGLVDKPHRGQFDNARDAAALGDRVDADPLLGLIVDLCSRHTRFVDGDLDLHCGAVPGVLGLPDERAVELADHLHGHLLAEPVLGKLHGLVKGDMVESEHGVVESFGMGVAEVFEGHVDGVGFLSGLGVHIGAEPKRAGEVDGLHVDTLLFWTVADRNEFPAFGVAAGGVKIEEGRVEGGGFDDCFRVGHD
ncbi:hypothetical protein NADE_008051 [Nannochloris sp. 'desiccata']|nr:hypothetical protein NADE_008051 [Chlorella desiccata (nom. nud.)]